MDGQEVKSLDTLQHSSWNPRRISKEDFNNLIQSIKEFGDLSGVVKNITTGTLVGGNQRLEAFKRLSNPVIQITEKLDQADKYGTVAYGYVINDGAKFGYREVEWSLEREKLANVAANRIQGEFDLDLLAQLNYEIMQLENGSDLLKLTGQSEDEINRLLKSVGAIDEEPDAGENLDRKNVLEIECVDDEQMQTIYNEMQERGLKCRILTL